MERTSTRTSPWIWAPLGFYLILAFVAVAYAIAWGVLDPGNSELAGVPLIVLGLPWSFVFHAFNPTIVASDYANAIIVTSLWIALNAVLIGLATFALSNYLRNR
jgi:hypothetical protein